jgi:beta-glucanase (GH16 family)
MRSSFSLLVLIIGVFFFEACSKKDAPIVNQAPSNLSVTASVSSDNSGNVSFIASATNASTYEYDFGNGIFQTVPSGIVTYKYPATGNYIVNVIAKNTAGQTISKSISVAVTVAVSLIWSDEFDQPGAPNPAKWGYDVGAGGWGNAELQFYTSRIENAVVSNGTLKIISTKENYSGSSYTSARLLTKEKFSFKYGKVEVRAKMPTGIGTWPAAWMLGSNINTATWPNCGEIDIVEHKGSDVNKIYGTLHYPGHFASTADGGTKVISGATTEFHIYSCEWSAASIKFYVDEVVYYSFANNNTLPFNQNFFVLLNLAMGGNFGGSVDAGFTNATFEVDYVRVYQ